MRNLILMLSLLFTLAACASSSIGKMQPELIGKVTADMPAIDTTTSIYE